MSDSTSWTQLLKRIKNRRRSIDVYLRAARPRSDRLTYVSIVSSALAAVLTAGPALGGSNFTTQAAKAFGLERAQEVWQPICVLALIVSVVAAISANLSKSRNAEAKIVDAEACGVALEGLQTLVEFQQVSLEDAIKLYQQYITKIPFISESVPAQPRSSRAARPKQNAS